MSTSTLHLGIFYMPQIYDMGPTALLPLRRKACWGFFFSPLKNPTASAGFEPANLGTKDQHATPRPPKPVPTYEGDKTDCNNYRSRTKSQYKYRKYFLWEGGTFHMLGSKLNVPKFYVFTKKLRTDWSEGMLTIFRCRIVCLMFSTQKCRD